MGFIQAIRDAFREKPAGPGDGSPLPVQGKDGSSLMNGEEMRRLQEEAKRISSRYSGRGCC